MTITAAQPAADEPAEAVIISGPRKGEFITVASNGETITADEQALIEQAITAAWQLAQSAKEARLSAQSLRDEIRESGEKLDELLRTNR